MGLHPSYLAAFRGGSPRHPFHPDSRAWHEVHVEVVADHELHREGVVRSTGERVLGFVGAPWWYRPEDFARLCQGARDERYRALALEVGP